MAAEAVTNRIRIFCLLSDGVMDWTAILIIVLAVIVGFVSGIISERRAKWSPIRFDRPAPFPPEPTFRTGGKNPPAPVDERPEPPPGADSKLGLDSYRRSDHGVVATNDAALQDERSLPPSPFRVVMTDSKKEELIEMVKRA